MGSHVVHKFVPDGSADLEAQLVTEARIDGNTKLIPNAEIEGRKI